MLLLHRELEQVGGRLAAVEEGDIPPGAQGRMMLAMHGTFADMEREAIVLRTRGGIRTRAELGGLICGPSAKFGYNRIQYRAASGVLLFGYAINEDTAPTVRRLFALVESGHTLRQIAELFNREGVPTPSMYLASQGLLRGKRKVVPTWSRQRIYQLLQDASYCGKHFNYHNQRVKVGNRYVMRVRPLDDATRIPVDVPAIVSEATWANVQDILASHVLTSPDSPQLTQEPKPLLAHGFVYCAHCGRRATTAKVNGYRAYICPNRGRENAAVACPGGYWNVQAAKVDADISAKLEAMRGDLPRFRRMMQTPQQAANDSLQASQRRQDALLAELAAATKRRDTIRRRMNDETDDDIAAGYRRDLLEVQAIVGELEKRTTDTALTVHRLTDVLHAVVRAVEAAAHADSLTREDRRALLRALGATVHVHNRSSDYAKSHAERWELRIAAQSQDASQQSA